MKAVRFFWGQAVDWNNGNQSNDKWSLSVETDDWGFWTILNVVAGMTLAQLTLTLSPCNNRHWQQQCQVMTTFAPVYARLCKHITPFRRLLAHCETFCILSNFEQFWANLSNFEQFWAFFSNFRQFFRACLGHLGKSEHFCRASVRSCRAILNNFWKHDVALLAMDNVQNVSNEAALRHLTLAEKGSWLPHGSRP